MAHSSAVKIEEVIISMTAETFRKCIIDLVLQNSMTLTTFYQPVLLQLIGDVAMEFIIREADAKKEELRKMKIINNSLEMRA